jgi:SAM-dependent methyltransferase
MKHYKDFYENYFNEDNYIVQLYDIGERSDRLMVKQLMKAKNGVLINLGCGLGDFRGDDNNFINVGIDISINSCIIAKKLHPSGHYLVADVQELPIKDSAVDSVVSIDVFEHIPDDKKAIDEIFRILKYDGEMVIHIPGNSRGIVPEDSKVYGHLRAYNEKMVTALLANFQIEELQHDGIFLNFFWLRLKKILKYIRILYIIFSFDKSIYAHYLRLLNNKMGWFRKGRALNNSSICEDPNIKIPSFYEFTWYQKRMLPFLESFIYKIDRYISNKKLMQRISESNINSRAVKQRRV